MERSCATMFSAVCTSQTALNWIYIPAFLNKLHLGLEIEVLQQVDSRSWQFGYREVQIEFQLTLSPRVS